MNDIMTIQLVLAIVGATMPSTLILLTVMLYLDRKQSKRMDDIDARHSKRMDDMSADIKVLAVSLNEIARQQSAMQAALDLIVYGNELPAPVARRRAREMEAMSDLE